MVYKFLDKKTSGSSTKNENMLDQHPSDLATRQLAEELDKAIVRKSKKRKVQSPLIDNIWGTGLADM